MSSRSRTKPNWSRQFSSPIRVKKGGPTFRTLSDVRAYLLKLPKDESQREMWQRTARLLMGAAQGGDMQKLEDQLILATCWKARPEMIRRGQSVGKRVGEERL